MDNKGKKITCTSMEKTNSRQFLIVITIIITISVVHFPNELNQKRSQYPNWSCDYKLPEFSLNLNLFLAFHTIFLILVPLNPLLFLTCSLFYLLCESKLLNFSQNIQSLSLSLLLQFILYQNALILSKQTLIS